MARSKSEVLAAVAQDGLALYHASTELMADKEVVLAAVAQNGHALKYALIDRADFKDFVRSRLVAHHTNVAFLLAAHPPSDPSGPAPALRPAPWGLLHIGEEAGAYVQQLIAAFGGAPCGEAWAATRAAAQNLPILI